MILTKKRREWCGRPSFITSPNALVVSLWDFWSIGLYRDPAATLGATASQSLPASRGFHPDQKTVGLGAFALFWFVGE